MKSLDQIEARTPISAAPFTINTPGSYYLTKNLSVAGGNAITITADNVALDLSGFTISSTAASAAGTAILLGGSGARKNISIFNGNISSGVTESGGTYAGSGFANGILSSVDPTSGRVSHVSISGVLVDGIHLGGVSNTVEFCTVNVAGSIGIFADSVSNSVAYDCGGVAIQAETASNCHGVGGGDGGGIGAITAINCDGSSVGNSFGISAATVSNCRGISSGGNGISATTVIDSFAQATNAAGISSEIAIGCRSSSTGAEGIFALTARGLFREQFRFHRNLRFCFSRKLPRVLDGRGW